MATTKNAARAAASYFQYPPCCEQTPPVLLHLLHVNLSPRID